MSVLTNILHFRSEIVTLYATFKHLDSLPESEGAGVILPTVRIEYANAANQMVTILPDSGMLPISRERFYYNWTVPDNAPYTTYTVIMSGVIDEIQASRTRELVIGNPSVTSTSPDKLRYGRGSVLIRPRDFSVRPHPALPRGTR